MQTKSSYRVLKWTFLAGMAASMATACVVSSGDGTDDDTIIGEGGDGGTKTTGGTNSGGGTKATGGSSAGSSAAGAPVADGGEPMTGEGGSPSTFAPGECQVADPITPTVEANCDAADGDNACLTCVKLQACPQFGTCFGTAPATACGVGQSAASPNGQFVCVTDCFKANTEGLLDEVELLTSCAATCDECGSGGLNDETTDLIEAANKADTCQTECFPFE